VIGRARGWNGDVQCEYQEDQEELKKGVVVLERVKREAL